MARLVTANGTTVDVDDEKAERLLASGYRKAESPSKTPTKRTAETSKQP